MAYTLKSAWSSRVVACIAVDQDNTTVKDFVTANSINLGTGVAAGVGSGTFKGNTRYYFPTIANGSFGFYGITWNATKPTMNWNPNATIFVILNDYTSSSGWVCGAGDNGNGVKLSSDRPVLYAAGGTRLTANTALATSTKQSFMVIARYLGTNEIHYGLESGSMSQDATWTDNGPWLADFLLAGYGGESGQGNFVSKTHLFLVTNDVISNTDRDSLHSDFVGTLFDTSSSSTIPVISRGYSRRRNS
jgi:hypothetical protein